MRKNFRHFFGLAAIIALAGLVPFAVDVPRARANITRAQTNASFISNAKTDHSLGLTNPVLSGNTIIVAVSYEADDIINPINPVSDSLGNTYTLAKHQSGALETDIYYAINGFVTAPLTVTIDYQVASGINSHLVVAEYTGALELDQVSGFNVASGFSHPSAPSPGITIIGPALAITASRLTTGFDLQLDSTGFYTFCNGTPPGTAFCSPGSAGSAGTARFLVREATPLLEAAGTFPGVTGAWGSVALENSTNALAVFKEPDLTPPTVSLTAPIDGATVSGTVTVSADASDPTVAGQSSSGVAGVQFKLDGADLDLEDTTAPYSINWDTTGASAGSHTLTAVARDVAGNITTSLPVTIIVDNTSPVISGVSVEGITDTGATVSWTTDEASDSQVEYGLDVSYGDSTVLDVSLVTSHTQDLSGLTPGTPYHYRVKSRDAAGNLATSADFTFTTAAFVDTIPPTVSLLSPAWGGVRGITLVSATASDNVGVAGVQFKASGANLGTEVTSFPYSFNWDTTTFPNGSYLLIEAVARDAAGNLTTSSPGAFVTVDNMPPAISLAEPADGATVSGVAVLISANASDVHTGVAGVQFKLDGNNLKAEDTAAPFSITWDTMTVANGSYTLTAVARDAAGNTTTASPISVTVNNPLPGGPSPTGVWQEPKYGPPFCGNAGCALPVTTLNVNQIIRSIGGNYATLGLNGVLRGGQRIFANDKVGVGPVPNDNPNGWNYEIDPIAALDVNGQIKVWGGAGGLGELYKTLTAASDTGLAEWREFWPLEEIVCAQSEYAIHKIVSGTPSCRSFVGTLQADGNSGLILNTAFGETTTATTGAVALKINTGTAPDAELKIDGNQLRFADCNAPNQIWQWNGTAWGCVAPPSFPAAPGNNIIYLKALGVGNEPPDCPAAGGFNTMDNTARESIGYLPGGANSVHRVRTCRQSNSNKRCQVLYLKSKINLPSCPGGFTPANSYSEYVPSDGVVNNFNNVQPCYRCVPP